MLGCYCVPSAHGVFLVDRIAKLEMSSVLRTESVVS